MKHRTTASRVKVRCRTDSHTVLADKACRSTGSGQSIEAQLRPAAAST